MNVVEDHRHAVAWRFGQTYIARDYGFEDLAAKEAAKICCHLLRERRTIVVHGEEDAFDRKGRIDRPAKPHQCVKELGDTFERQVLALDRYKNGVAGRERIQGKEIEGRRAVDQDVFVFFPRGRDSGFEAILPILHSNQLNRGSNQILVRRNQIKTVHLGIDCDALEWLVENNGLI